jgi:hypothetical protein
MLTFAPLVTSTPVKDVSVTPLATIINGVTLLVDT